MSAILAGCVTAIRAPGADAVRGADTYQRLIEDLVRREYPELLAGTAPRGSRYLYLVGDGRGRVARRLLETRPPAVAAVPDALVEKFPDLPLARWLETASDAAFPLAGMSRHDPGTRTRVGPDTLWVFWADEPVPLAAARELRGGFHPGLAVSEQVTPDTVARYADAAAAGNAVWYVMDDERHVLGIGTWAGDNPEIPARQDELAPSFPEGSLTCSLATSIRTPSGRLVRIVPIRYQPRRGGAARP